MDSISVMLVDDNPTFLRVATQFLEAHKGVNVVGTANGGEEALTIAETERPQVVLIDLAMPDLPGLKAIPRLREMLPDAGIIALTVMNTKSFREAALSVGANIFLPKAHMRTDLLPAIRRLTQVNGEKTREMAGSLPDRHSAPRRVLVIEDDNYLRHLYSKALRTAGYDVHPAGTMKAARDLLTRVRFDVLLCDVRIGPNCSTELLDEYADTLDTNNTRVIMISGQTQFRDTCREMGADHFLEKPVAIGTLVGLVDRLSLQNNPLHTRK
jgi:DNA-binding response OmpR family regulator